MRSQALVAIGAAVVLSLAAVTPAAAQQASAPASPTSAAVQLPVSPDPVAVTADHAKTAVLVEDIADQTCKPQPRCTNGMVPNIVTLLKNARAAGAYVLYTVPPTGSPVLADVAPQSGDPVFSGAGQDRFFNTNLDYLLRSHGITTLLLAGWREDGSVMYTSVGATLRGYTVVVADDCVGAAQDYDVAVGRFMMLTQLSGNATNQPLKDKATTLSRSDLITFQ